jgi:hypothetical protein
VDTDILGMTWEQLVEEVRRLRAGIRKHRDATEQDLCWHHPELWSLLPEEVDPVPAVPDWANFMMGCVRYRQSLDTQAPNSPRAIEPPHIETSADPDVKPD